MKVEYNNWMDKRKEAEDDALKRKIENGDRNERKRRRETLRQIGGMEE